MAAARVDFQLPPKIITPRNGYFIRPLSGHRRPLFTFHARACLISCTRKVTVFRVPRPSIHTVLRVYYAKIDPPPPRNPYHNWKRFIATKYYIIIYFVLLLPLNYIHYFRPRLLLICVHKNIIMLPFLSFLCSFVVVFFFFFN